MCTVTTVYMYLHMHARARTHKDSTFNAQRHLSQSLHTHARARTHTYTHTHTHTYRKKPKKMQFHHAKIDTWADTWRDSWIDRSIDRDRWINKKMPAQWEPNGFEQLLLPIRHARTAPAEGVVGAEAPLQLRRQVAEVGVVGHHSQHLLVPDIHPGHLSI
jgi:hypothetical protein